MMKRRTSKTLYAVVIVTVVLSLISKLVFNKMIDEEHFLHISHGALDIAMQKRADLNRNALAATTAYVEMEGELMHHLMDLAREVKTGTNAARILALSGEIERLAGALDLLVMKSPNLKAKGPYIYLMETFRENENGVLKARMHYNWSVCEYRRFLDEFPYNLVARLYGFRKYAIFTASPAARLLPELDSGGTGIIKRSGLR
jgi:LemA protein